MDLVNIELAQYGAGVFNFVYNLICGEYVVLLQRNLIFSVADRNVNFLSTRHGLHSAPLAGLIK